MTRKGNLEITTISWPWGLFREAKQAAAKLGWSLSRFVCVAVATVMNRPDLMPEE